MPNKNKSRSKHSRSRKPSTDQGPVIAVGSLAEFERYLDSEDPVIVDFWATWCGPCQAMGPIYAQVAGELAGEAAEAGGRQVRFLKVNTEQLPEISGAFGIRSIPTLLVLHGREVTDSHVGLIDPAGLKKLAKKALDRAEGRTLGQRIKRMFSTAA